MTQYPLLSLQIRLRIIFSSFPIMKGASFFSCLLIFTGLLGCSESQKNDILVKVEDYELTKASYEFILGNNRKTDKQINDALMEQAFIMAYALEHHYDTITHLQKKMLYGCRLFSSEALRGYVWKKKYVPLIETTSQKIESHIPKRQELLTFDIIHFSSEEAVNKYLIERDSLSSDEFLKLKTKAEVKPDIMSSRVQCYYPYYPVGIYIDDLHDASIGRVWGPIETIDGYNFYLLDNREIIQSEFSEKDKMKFLKKINQLVTEKYQIEDKRALKLLTNPVMYDDSINQMVSHYLPDQKAWPGVDTDMALMDYTFQGDRYSYTVADFIEFTQCEPLFFGDLSVCEDIKKMFWAYLNDIYKYEEAQKIGMGTDEEFLLFKDDFRRKLYVQHFWENEINKNIDISEDDIVDYYNIHQHNYQTFETAFVSAFEFSDLQLAFDSLRSLIIPQRQRSQDSAMDKSLIPDNVKTLEVNINDTDLDENLVAAISKAGLRRFSKPFKMKDKYFFIYVDNESGETYFPLKYIRNTIENKLFISKQKENYEHFLGRLKAKYEIVENHLINK